MENATYIGTKVVDGMTIHEYVSNMPDEEREGYMRTAIKFLADYMHDKEEQSK